jgi:oxalate decarboxylase
MNPMSRKQLIAAGAAGVVAASLGEDALAANGNPTLPHSTERFHFPLGSATPDDVTPYGSVTKVNVKNMPALAGSDAAIFLVRMKPGALREPHWHPNAWEIDYVVSGHLRFGIVDPAGTTAIFDVGPGDCVFVPQGWAHFIRNAGSTEAVVPITFGNDNPDDVGLSTVFGGMPTNTFEDTLGLKHGALAKARKAAKTLLFVR